MKTAIWIVSLVIGLALPIGAMWYSLRKREPRFGDELSPQWLHEHAYDREGDRQFK